jgi:endonuclease-8
MPEGPQMVFLKEQIDYFIGDTVLEAAGNAVNIPYELVKGQPLIDIKTFGKELLFCFPFFTLRIHLMLFGKYAVDSELNRELKLSLRFEGGTINFYACECRFITEELDEVYEWSTDVINSAFDPNIALQKLKSKLNHLICEALLDQNILAGVGNKIKNEVLFRMRIHPQSLVGKIPETAQKKLIEECVKLSFEYLDWKRNNEDNDHWEVYKKKECTRDGMPIIKEKIGKSGRSSYFCDKCQVLYADEDV